VLLSELPRIELCSSLAFDTGLISGCLKALNPFSVAKRLLRRAWGCHAYLWQSRNSVVVSNKLLTTTTGSQ